MEPAFTEPPAARLIATQPYVQPPEWTLDATNCTIGRARRCTIVVDQHTISRVHARIERSGTRYLLKDDSSINGTFVNGQRIYDTYVLQQDDLIGLGSATAILRFLDPDPTAVSASSLRYDSHARAFYLGRKRVDLSPSQLRLLAHLYEYAGEICSHESCAQAIWGPEYDEIQLGQVDRAINRLRTKFRQLDSSADPIKNERGQGYTLVLESFSK
jgi:pSer/pThr/pTyr-binding forkhead associated (FHA) protein